MPSRLARDAIFAVFVCVAGIFLSLIYHLDEAFHIFVGGFDDIVDLNQMPTAFLFAAVAFGWFAWRRWHDSEQAVDESDKANKLLSEQLSRNKEIISDLAAARQRALDLDRAKTRFLSHMSHELRTPLNAILGFSDLMQQQIYGPLGHDQYVDYTASIHESGAHLLDLINDLLDLTRIESGDLTPHPEVCTMGALIGEAFKMLRDQAAEVGIHLTQIHSAADDIPVSVDRRMIRQVLINLIANAIRHTPRGGLIDVSAVEAPGSTIGFTVKDNGEGMEEGVVQRLERGFAEVENAFRREHHGAGIGLPLSRAIAKAHGGELHISSAEGEGTLVEVQLPAECIAREAAPQQQRRIA